MRLSRRRDRILLVLAVAILGGGAAAWVVVSSVRSGKVTSYQRGQQAAARLGCFACHGPGGERGVVTFNPEHDEVPTWDPLTFGKFVKTRAELSEWILDGIPERMRASADHQERIRSQLIRMPAFKDRISAAELEDLIVYVGAVAAFQVPASDAARRGQEVALSFGCFSCHGAEGRGQMPNPGAFKGYIPAWDGDDYLELVRTPAEFREWLKDGVPKRLKENPAAAFFLERQVLKMPAYGDRLAPGQVDDLEAFIAWLRTPLGSTTGGPLK